MSRALMRLMLLLLSAIGIAACSQPSVGLPLGRPGAANVDGQEISMAAYQARLNVSQARDPYAGMPDAVPSPAPGKRLEDFTIDQLVREAIVAREAKGRGLRITDQQVAARISQLEQSAGSQPFHEALDRNGFTQASFRDYQRALLTEVGLLQTMAKQRVNQAEAGLKAGQSFNDVVDKFNDDQGTTARHGEVGWLRPGDLPEPELRDAVQSLARGGTTSIVQTNRGFLIAKVLDQRGDQIRLAVIVVLAPSADLFSAQGTPSWFTSFLDQQESALRTAGKITIRVGSHA